MHGRRVRRPKGEGSIIQRSDGRWAYVINLGSDPKTGQRRRRTIYAKTRPQLLAKVSDLKVKGGGTIRPRAVGTVGEYLARWLRVDVKPNRAPSTYSLYEMIVRRHVAPQVGAMKLEHFDANAVAELYARLRAAGVTPSVVHRTAIVLGAAFEVARKRKNVLENPVRSVEAPRYRSKPVKALGLEEARRFLKAARGDRFEAVFVLCLLAGLRIGEALGLRWKDVDFDAKTIRVEQQLVNVDGVPEIRETKTEKSRRTIAIDGRSVEALERRRAAWKAEGHGSELVFTTSEGKPLHRSNVYHRSRPAILKRAGLSDRTSIHALRHTAASLLMAANVPLKVVSDRMGHSTTRLTADLYQHASSTLQRDASRRLEALISEEEPISPSPRPRRSRRRS